MTTTTNQTNKQIDAGTFVDEKTKRTFTAAIFGVLLVLAALIAFTTLNGRVGTVSLAANVAAPADGTMTLGMIHALESGYNPGAVSVEASADSIVTLGMIHAFESGYRPAVQPDSILTLDKRYALENGASFEAVTGYAPAVQPAAGTMTLGMIHALESGYNPGAVSAEALVEGALTLGMIHALESGYRPAVQADSILTLDLIHAYESGYVPGE